MNTIQSRMMGQAISERMYSSYIQVNNRRLAQVVSKSIGAAQDARIDRIEKLQSPKGLQPTKSLEKVDLRSKVLSFEQSDFLRSYRNNMLDIQSMAAELAAGRAEIVETLAAGSDNPSVAEVSGRLGDISDRYILSVDQIATGQVSRSAPMDPSDPFPTASGSLRLETSQGSAELFMSGAGFEDNRAMLEFFAEQINRQNLGITASVEMVEMDPMSMMGSADGLQMMGLEPEGEGLSMMDGMEEEGGILGGGSLQLQEGEGEDGGWGAILKLESDLGGEGGMFQVGGTLADKLGITQSQGDPVQEALYSIVKNSGLADLFGAELMSSDSNSIMLDDGISALLKGAGVANISSITDAAESMADQLSQMVGKYNDMMSFLMDNGQRGMGVQNQLRRMGELPRSGDMLERIGITRVRDGVLNLDRSAFIDQSRRAPSLTNQIMQDFAEDLRVGAREGMRESSGSLVGPLEYVAREESKQLDPVNVLSTYSRNGVYNLMNLYAAGVLMNLNA